MLTVLWKQIERIVSILKKTMQHYARQSQSSWYQHNLSPLSEKTQTMTNHFFA